MESEKYLKRILVLADTHVGSLFGLWDPKFKRKDGNIIGLNPLQKIMWEYWKTMCRELNQQGHRCDFAVLNGDMIDGVGYRSLGIEQMTTDVDDQRYCFEDCWSHVPLKNRREVYVTVGSDYHELRGANAHREICTDLTGDDDTFFLDTGGILEVDGWKIDVSHGSTSAFIYLEQPIAREQTFMFSSSALNKCSYADIIAMSHVHVYKEIKSAGARLHQFPGLLSEAVVTAKVVTTPAFQAQTTYMRKKSKHKLIPDLGYMILEVDEQGVHIKERLFRPIIIGERIRCVN